MNPDDMTDEQIRALARNPEFRKLLSDEERAALQASELDYLRACSAEEFADAEVERTTRELFDRTVRLVNAARQNPEELEHARDEIGAAFAERIKRLIAEGQEVDERFVAELMSIREGKA